MIIYIPMIQAHISMLACARIGAVHSVVFGGFASNELAVRINDAKPKVIITASCGIEVGRVIDYKPLLDGAIALADHKPAHTIIKQRPQKPCALKEVTTSIGTWSWRRRNRPNACRWRRPIRSISSTSGTTGEPKGVVRDNGGHLVALNWTMKNVYDINPGEVWWAASDVGWVVGHSYIVYAPLFAGRPPSSTRGKPVGARRRLSGE